MRPESVAVCLTIFVSSLGLISSGCSLAGFEFGRSIDNRSPNRSVDRLQIPGISEGATVQVVKSDCRILKGTFLGTDTLPLVEYARAYSTWLRENHSTDSLPSIGERVNVDAQLAYGDNRYEGQFLGFDHRSIWFHQGGQINSTHIDLRSVRGLLRENGVVITGSHLRDLSLNASLPRMYIIRIQVEGQTRVVHLDEVKEIIVPSKKNARWVGLVGGLALDAVAVWVIVGVVIPAIDYFKIR